MLIVTEEDTHVPVRSEQLVALLETIVEEHIDSF